VNCSARTGLSVQHSLILRSLARSPRCHPLLSKSLQSTASSNRLLSASRSATSQRSTSCRLSSIRVHSHSTTRKRERAKASTQESAQRENGIKQSELYYLPSVPSFLQDLPTCHHTSANTFPSIIIHSSSKVSSFPSLSSSPLPPSLIYIQSYHSEHDFLSEKFGKLTPNYSEMSLAHPTFSLSLSLSLFSLSLSSSLLSPLSLYIILSRTPIYGSASLPPSYHSPS